MVAMGIVASAIDGRMICLTLLENAAHLSIRILSRMYIPVILLSTMPVSMRPCTGVMPSLMLNMYIIMMPSQNTGIETPKRAPNITE